MKIGELLQKKNNSLRIARSKEKKNQELRKSSAGVENDQAYEPQLWYYHLFDFFNTFKYQILY